MPTTYDACAGAIAEVESRKAVYDNLDAPLTSLCLTIFRTDDENHAMRVLYAHRMNALIDLQLARKIYSKVWGKCCRKSLVEFIKTTSGTVVGLQKTREEYVLEVEGLMGRPAAEAVLGRLEFWVARKGCSLMFAGDAYDDAEVVSGVAGNGDEWKSGKGGGTKEEGEKVEGDKNKGKGKEEKGQEVQGEEGEGEKGEEEEMTEENIEGLKAMMKALRALYLPTPENSSK